MYENDDPRILPDVPSAVIKINLEDCNKDIYV